MVPPFQPRRLVPAMFSFIIDRVNQLNDELAQAAATGEDVEMDACMMQLTLDVICQYLFGFSGQGENGLDFQDVGEQANIMVSCQCEQCTYRQYGCQPIHRSF